MDPNLQEEIELTGKQHTLFGLHLCDWRVNTRDLLTGRGLMGDSCIDINKIGGWGRATGFDGMDEAEVFSDEYCAMNQSVYLDKIIERYRDCC